MANDFRFVKFFQICLYAAGVISVTVAENNPVYFIAQIDP